MEIKIPKLSLVVLIGVSGSGKSSFAKKCFKGTEILSSDYCRALVSDDETNQAATDAAFQVLHFIASKRLAAGRLTVVDATHVQPEARKPLISLAREYHAIPVAIVFDLPEKICQDRNRSRPDRDFGGHVIRQQHSQLLRSLRGLKKEGFRHIHTISTEADANGTIVERVAMWNDRNNLKGPFDIVGDLHGCFDELTELLEKLGYTPGSRNPENPMAGPIYSHPEGRMMIFLGDIVDRGPAILATLRLVTNMVNSGSALCVPGNHDIKFLRKLNGKDVQITHGLAETMREIDALDKDAGGAFIGEIKRFIDGLISHYVLDGGRLVVAHAGLKQEMQGRGSARVREFCLFGETTGEIDAFGLPVRHNWAAEYRGPAIVVHGHTPVPEAEWLNRTINIDTGCVFGGKLTALRYPEKELVSVPARRIYCEPARPFKHQGGESESAAMTSQQYHDDLLDAEDVLGKRLVTTRLRSNVTIREANAIAALEVMSRYAANPKWLIYLPPTMSPTETSRREGYLEYPQEAFSYYRANGIPRVVCQVKHMGSRAVVIVCKNEAAAMRCFGVRNEGIGIVYTRTGRRFFSDLALEQELLAIIRGALDALDFWSEFSTEWICLDCELMPWSEKAKELLKTQYAAVGAAATASLSAAIENLRMAGSRIDLDIGFKPSAEGTAREFKIDDLLKKCEARKDTVESYITAYQQYCWPVNSLKDLRIAPFHVLATEGQVHVDKDHKWHMNIISRICAASEEILLSTSFSVVDVDDEQSMAAACRWWEDLTGKGGEGMVVKPHDFISRGKKGLVQPAVKCRGREYLRIIYGPEYTLEENLDRLRSRSLGPKRSLALREFALGVEALERFVRKEPLRRVHECVFGVLALESEPVDPRL
ncbi:MAG: polynucleotide kinase-phosphatase [Deltaproteobacteria bacterium]|nr:polynucleotide kinase-phosphatase [Deltaproteobacteria bacterium]